MNKWYEENLSNNDIVISSRVSLLRNLMDYPFPMNMEMLRSLTLQMKAGTIFTRGQLTLRFQTTFVRPILP